MIKVLTIKAERFQGHVRELLKAIQCGKEGTPMMLAIINSMKDKCCIPEHVSTIFAIRHSAKAKLDLIIDDGFD